MAGMCKAVLIGHLGGDAEIRYTGSGMAVLNFSMAATERVKGEDKTEWFRVAIFGKFAEAMEPYLKKGKQVYIEGRLQTNEWQDKNGNNRFSLEVVANTVQILGKKDDNPAAPQKQGNGIDPAIKAKNEAIQAKIAQEANGSMFGGAQPSGGDDIPF